MTLFLIAPAPIPVPMELTISIAGLNVGGVVYATAPTMASTTYFGGLGCNVAAGLVPWQRGDRLAWTVANDGAGKFQDFWRRHYKTQLPSSASPTISDALVV